MADVDFKDNIGVEGSSHESKVWLFFFRFFYFKLGNIVSCITVYFFYGF